MTTRTNHLNLYNVLEATNGWNVLTNEEMERVKKLYMREKGKRNEINIV